MWRSFGADLCLALAIGLLIITPLLTTVWLTSRDMGALPCVVAGAVVGLHGPWLRAIPFVPLCSALFAILSLRLKRSRLTVYVLGVSGVVTVLLMGLLWTYHGEIPGWLR